MQGRAFTFALVVLATTACGARSPLSSAPPATADDAGSLAGDSVFCGEIRGRVLDASTGAPMPGVYVSIDSFARPAMTDSLGLFRIVVTRFEPGQPGQMPETLVRIRRIGFVELKFHLEAGLGYVIEARLALQALHADHVSTLRIKTPGFCARAT